MLNLSSLSTLLLSLSFAVSALAQDHPVEEEVPIAVDEERPLADSSIYHLSDTWTTQAGEPFVLSSLRGHPVVVLMFYGSCEHVCPILIHDVQEIDAQLPDEERWDVRFLMVTFDPDHDTPEALAALAAAKELDLERYTLLTGGDTATRALAALPGVQYRRNANGHINHSNIISLLDREGTLVVQIEGLQQAPTPILEGVMALQ